MLAALAGQAERQVQDAFHLFAGINAGIVGRIAILATALRTTEIHTAGQFAHAQKIGAFDDLGFQRGTIGQRIEHGQRTQVGIQAERLAHPEQPLFRTHLGRRIVIVLRIADRPEQHHIGSLANGVRFGRIRIAGRVDRASAYERLLVVERVFVLCGNAVQNLYRFAHDFRADAVPGQKSNFQFHHLFNLQISNPFISRTVPPTPDFPAPYGK